VDVDEGGADDDGDDENDSIDGAIVGADDDGKEVEGSCLDRKCPQIVASRSTPLLLSVGTDPPSIVKPSSSLSVS
jgi:hypothetical protein